MNVRLNRGVWALLLLLMLAFMVPAEAAGHVKDADFSCRGVALGDTEAQLLNKFGTPLHDKNITMQGVAVKVYTFPKQYEVAVTAKSGKVVDFKIADEHYQARNHMRIGATSFWIEKTYGKQDRQQLDGETCYIYTNPKQPHERLVLNVDAEKGYLTSWHITALPLTDEEAEQWEIAGDAPDEGPLDWRIEEKEIDTSNLPKDKPVRLREGEAES